MVVVVVLHFILMANVYVMNVAILYVIQVITVDVLSLVVCHKNYTMSQVGCLNGARFQRDLYGDTGQCTLCDMTRYRCPIVTGTGIDAKIVQGSCFPWMGGWPGGWACNNCHKANLINHPYALAVGLTSTDCHCSLCWSQCCSGCCGASCQSQRCFPGYGASAMLTCGGYTAMYQDLGRRGAWCVQYC